MGRRTRREVKAKNNRGNHRRKRTTRGYRMMSKFKKYCWYDKKEEKGGDTDGETKKMQYK